VRKRREWWEEYGNHQNGSFQQIIRIFSEFIDIEYCNQNIPFKLYQVQSSFQDLNQWHSGHRASQNTYRASMFALALQHSN